MSMGNCASRFPSMTSCEAAAMARARRLASRPSSRLVCAAALKSVVAKAATHHYDTLIAGATQAVRQATDGEMFARQAGLAIGVPVHIIPAHREAELSFLGAASHHAAKREWVVIDLGAGPTRGRIGAAP